VVEPLVLLAGTGADVSGKPNAAGGGADVDSIVDEASTRHEKNALPGTLAKHYRMGLS
jgi:hypothetical protein